MRLLALLAVSLGLVLAGSEAIYANSTPTGAPPPTIPSAPSTSPGGGGGGGSGGGGSMDAPISPDLPINGINDIMDQTDKQQNDRKKKKGDDGADAIPDQICVVFQPGQPAGTDKKFADDFKLEQLGAYQLRGLNLQVVLFRVKNPAELEATLQRAGADGRQLWVQRNYRIHTLQDTAGQTSAGVTGNVSKQYALERIHASALPPTADGRGVTLALIDSGVDRQHETLQKTEITEIDLIAGGHKPPSEIHGTVMAGIIAGSGKLKGIAPGVKLLALRAFAEVDPKSGAAESNSFLLSLGVNSALENGAKVISLSLGGPKDRLVGEAIHEALMESVVVVAAAGNTGPDGDPVYPAAQDGVIAVTATDAKDRLYSHATRGKYISVAAPGVDIVAATPGNAYGYFTGTSMATGYVAGLAAILLEQSPKLNAVTLRKTLEATAQDLGPPKKDGDFGWGRIDAAQAFAATHQVGAAD